MRNEMEDMKQQTIEQGKQAAKNAVKNALEAAGRAILSAIAPVLPWIIIGIIIFLVIAACIDWNDVGVTASAQGMNSASSNSWDQFVAYLHMKEGGGTIYQNDAGVDCYKVISDGSATGSAVGYGVDIGTYGSELRAQGYDTSKGSLIPVDVVDSIELRELQDNKTSVLNTLSSNAITLEEYQVFALLSRAYNCGVYGALKTRRGSQSLNFVEAYQKYWSSSDTHYQGSVDFNHSLYTEFMYYPVTSGGKYLAGLENRRKSEWILFQTGYYDALGEYWQESYGGAGGEFAADSRNYLYGTFTSNITGKTFCLIKQTASMDGKGQIFPSQCNRASGVTILSGYYSGTVEDAIRRGQSVGEGFPSTATLYDGSGLKVTNVSGNISNYQSYIKTQLQNGNYILMRFSSYTTGKSGAKWASNNGHWIAILGYKTENGEDKIFTGDPGYGHNDWYSIDEFENVKGTTMQYLYLVEPTK